MSQDKEREAFLPCPHCGEQPLDHAIEPHQHTMSFGGVKMPDHTGSHVVECSCGAGMIDETREAVLARWNRRAALATQPPAVQGEPVWIQPDHLQKARIAPFLCRVEPTKRIADFVPLYTASPPSREPLTDDAILDAFCHTPGIHQFVQAFKAGVRFAERAHGIHSRGEGEKA